MIKNIGKKRRGINREKATLGGTGQALSLVRILKLHRSPLGLERCFALPALVLPHYQ